MIVEHSLKFLYLGGILAWGLVGESLEVLHFLSLYVSSGT